MLFAKRQSFDLCIYLRSPQALSPLRVSSRRASASGEISIMRSRNSDKTACILKKLSWVLEARTGEAYSKAITFHMLSEDLYLSDLGFKIWTSVHTPGGSIRCFKHIQKKGIFESLITSIVEPIVTTIWNCWWLSKVQINDTDEGDTLEFINCGLIL